MKRTAIALALSLGFSVGAYAEEPVLIIYEVIGTEGEAFSADAPTSAWKRISVDSDQLSETLERLRNDATIGRVELDQPMQRVRPAKEEKAYPSMRTQSAESEAFNDPEFTQQEAWKNATEDRRGRLNIEAAMHIYLTSKRMKLGVIDGGFVSTNDITYAAGADMINDSDTFEENVIDGSCAHRHGTQVAHVAAAERNNGAGMVGVANADVYAARALNCNGSGFHSYTSDALLWLSGESVAGVTSLEEPVDAINISISGLGACPGYLQSAIDTARSKGIVITVAAGNDSADAGNFSPANCEGVIVVGANRFDGQLSSFSNTGEVVDIYASGSGVFTTSNTGDYDYVYGTSFSSPIVAAHATLIKAVEPEADETRIIRLLSDTTENALVDAELSMTGVGQIMDSLAMARGVADLTYVARPLVHALMHEGRSAAHYTQAAISLDICNLYEVDTTKLEVTRSDRQFFKVFKVAKSSDFTVTNGVEVARSQGSRVLLKNVDPTVNNYGLSVCNSDNSVCDQEIPVNLNVQKSFTDLYCS